MGQKPDSDLNPTYRLRFQTAQGASGVNLDLSLDAPEQQIVPELQPREDELVIVKTTSGVFNSTKLEDILRAMGKEELFVAGVVTNTNMRIHATSVVLTAGTFLGGLIHIGMETTQVAVPVIRPRLRWQNVCVKCHSMLAA